MASILNRYENIMSTNVCGMIEFAEDPMKMARHLSHHMEDDLSKTKREGAELIAEIEKLEDQQIGSQCGSTFGCEKGRADEAA